jgi:prophage maintenance system killer protein
MNNRILDRHNYNKKTIDNFEILAAYFIDIYYNHLYIEAKKLRTDNAVSSVTEGYKHALKAYLKGVDNPKYFKKTLMGIHGYYTACGYTSMTFRECTETITKEFIPKDYYESVISSQKTSILKLVISESNKKMIFKIASEYLSMIIDNHLDETNLRILQDEYIDILILARENVYHRFISSETNTSSGTKSNDILQAKMQKEIKVLLTEKYQLKKTITDLKKIILKKEAQLISERESVTILKDRINNIVIPVVEPGPKTVSFGTETDIMWNDEPMLSTKVDETELFTNDMQEAEVAVMSDEQVSDEFDSHNFQENKESTLPESSSFNLDDY